MEGTIAEIRMFGGNFSPRAWALCEGQILSISQNTALFALLGTTFGGNGQTTFALPDFRGRSPFGEGQGPGLPTIGLGQVSGANQVTLALNNLPVHNHPIASTNLTVGAKAERTGTTDSPVSNYNSILGGSSPYSATSDGNMAPINGNSVIGASGGGQPASTRSPYLGINFIICLQGIFPSRN